VTTGPAIQRASTRRVKDRQRPPAPGARVLIRDEEWVVRKAEYQPRGGMAVHVTGAGDLVRGKEAIFLTELDELIELRPEETRLAADRSPGYRQSRLFLESLLRRTPPTDDALYVGHRAALEPAPYQLEPAAQALGQPRPRILMADGVGLGKTVEVGILLSELIERGRAERILVVALKSILAQFQQELWARFTIPLVRLDSVGIQRVQQRIPANMNPFYVFDRVIVSIDTLKKDEKYRRYLEQCRWDVVVVDECQNVAVRGAGVRGSGGRSQRARLADLLARTTDALVLTSATPHDGRPESFASLMNLLEPTAVADPQDFTRDEVEHLFIRRFKKDVDHQVSGAFREREIELRRLPASPDEDAAFERLNELDLRAIGRAGGGGATLFKTVLLKAFLSSPAACLETARNRLKTLEDRLAKKKVDPADAAHDRAELERLVETVERVGVDRFTKYGALLAELRALGYAGGGAAGADRVVVFSERIATLSFLQERLTEDLGLAEDQIQVFHGSLDDQEQRVLVQSFGTEDSRLRILLASDAASEGINLHHFCHRMVHFDLPWSLITLEQRNGRIDRFGQRHTPRIAYLLTVPGDEELRGDLRVLERLVEKEEEAHKNLGDVAWLMNLWNAEKEEERIAKGIEQGEAPEEILPDEPAGGDWLTELFGSGRGSEAKVAEPLRLFGDDLEYARLALEEIGIEQPGGRAARQDAEEGRGAVEWHDDLDGLTLYPPEDLQVRYDYLPPELRRDGDAIKLTTDRRRVMQALDASRDREGAWPEWELLWELHPVSEWLDDRVLARLSRHEAPVLVLPGHLAAGEAIVLLQGIVSNRRGQPVIVDWFGVRFERGELTGTEPLSAILARVPLRSGVANPDTALAAARLEELQALLEPAVRAAVEHMKDQRLQRAGTVGEPLREGVRRLTRWKQRSLEFLEERRKQLGEPTGAARIRLKRLEAEERRVRELYDERSSWIDDGVKTVEDPYVRVAAVLVGG
jgi:hypothetical protein